MFLAPALAHVSWPALRFDSFGGSSLGGSTSRGAAVLWPSVLDRDPNERDDRTEHEAVAVREGTKFAANYWLHLWDFEGPDALGCGNTEVFGNW